MSVYTKTGDKGKTGTFGGKRISKSSGLIGAIGAIDELNSYLGIINTRYKQSLPLRSKDIKLIDIQKNLFTINSILSGAELEFPKDATKKLEKEIDDMEGKMPVLANFIIYSGTPRATKLYYARALARRAECALVAVPNILHTTYYILPYLNRLSDYLFTLARFTNFKKKVKEEVWKT
ncbi:MAG: cob(I)yrinic acid a,c-diamide adenosyltransferase [Patescibacteria group bacterium]